MENKVFASQGHEDGSITIRSGARLSIENAADFARCLSEALASSERVFIDFEANVEADVSTLQILCSACKTAAAKGKSVMHQGAGLEALRQLIISAGAEGHGACAHNNDRLCVWIGGDE